MVSEISNSRIQSAGRQRGRPKTMSDEELHERLLSAALEIVTTERGTPSVSLDHMNLEVVMRRADVSRSAVTRLFPDKAGFTGWLIDAAIETSNQPDTQMFNEGDTASTLGVIGQSPDIKKSSVEKRKSLAARVIGHTLINNVTRQQNIIRPSVIALADSAESPESQERCARDILDVHAATVARASTFFATVSKALALDSKPGMSYPDLASAGVAYLGGAALLPEAFAKSDGFEPSVHLMATALVDGYLQSI